MSEKTPPPQSHARFTPPLNPVFVVGMVRSGTSLLYSLLNQHSKVALMYECDVLDFPPLFSKARFRGDWLERQEFYNQALSRNRLIFGGKMLGLEGEKGVEHIYEAFAKGTDAALWGEKSPFYSVRLRELAQQFPAIGLIVLWRDPVEVFRSITLAGRFSRFFRRRGMLSRLIHDQEVMLRDAARLQAQGTRMFRVSYPNLVDETEAVCRHLCEFLGLAFEPGMITLDHADLSAVYQAPHHEHLRGGVITRRESAENLVSERHAELLKRFHVRWHRLYAGDVPAPMTCELREPGLVSVAFFSAAGRIYGACDATTRLAFEFLPLSWLKGYRQTRQWFFDDSRGSMIGGETLSISAQFTKNWKIISHTGLLFVGLVALHHFTDAHLTFLPLYLIPCLLLTLRIGLSWGMMGAVFAAAAGPVLLGLSDQDYENAGLLIWNITMRYLLLAVILIVVRRIQLEIHGCDERSSPA